MGVVRVLGRRGLTLRASVAPHDFVSGSRWLSRRAHLPAADPAVPLAEYLERLPLREAFLIPCSDELALQAAELPPDLAARFRTYQPNAAVLRLLTDKGVFLRAVKALGIPHPRTHIIDAVGDLEALSDTELATAFIKPRDSQRFHREMGVKALRPHGREEFRSLLSALLEKKHRLMIQEYISGPASNHYFIDGFATEGGEIVTLFARRRLRMFPVDFGNSTFMVSVPPDDVQGAIEPLLRLLSHLEYRGIFSAEFKRDASDGAFKIIEVNARPWWYIEFTARAGVDVLRLACEAAFGLPLNPPTSYQVGRTLTYPYYDHDACRAVIPGRWAPVRRLVADALGADQPVFAWDDPLPAIRYWVRVMPQVVSRRLSRRRAAAARSD